MPASKHADLLNALDEMQQSPQYALRRDVLRQAENLISSQERRIDILSEAANSMAAELCSLVEKIEDAGWHKGEVETAKELIEAWRR